MIKAIFLLIPLVVIAVLVYAATTPDAFRIERSIVIRAGAEKIFPLVNDLHQWEHWSPWEKLDASVRRA